jgi:hypothetical protein
LLALALAGFFLVSGASMLAGGEAWAGVLAPHGNAREIMFIGGAFRVGAALLLVAPKGREYGAALGVAILIGAALLQGSAESWSGLALSLLLVVPAAWLMWFDRSRTFGTSYPDRTVTDIPASSG